jgi:ABC-type amino acid transport substrate-binding protein
MDIDMIRFFKSFSALSYIFAGFLTLTLSMQAFSASPTLDRVIKNNVLKVAMSGDQPPFNVISRNNKLIGYDVELANYFANTMQVNLEIVQMPFGEIAEAVKTGKVDLGISGMAITSRRTQDISFVGPYNVSGKSMLTTRINAEKSKDVDFNNSDVRIAALKSSTSESFAKLKLPKARLKTIADYDEGIKLLLDGDVDAMIADMTIAKLSVLRNPDSGLVTNKAPLSIEPIGIAMAKDDMQFANLVRNYLNTFEKMGITKKLNEKWFENSAWIAALP